MSVRTLAREIIGMLNLDAPAAVTAPDPAPVVEPKPEPPPPQPPLEATTDNAAPAQTALGKAVTAGLRLFWKDRER
jgi:hypothetical protein